MGRASYRIVWVWDEHWMGWNRDCPAAICGTSLLISDLQHSPSGRGNWSVCDRKDTCSYALRPGTPNRWIENPLSQIATTPFPFLPHFWITSSAAASDETRYLEHIFLWRVH